MDKCNDIAEKAGVTQRQKYKLRRVSSFYGTPTTVIIPRRIKKSKKAKKRLRTIVNTQLRKLDEKLTVYQKSLYREQLELYKRIE